MYPHQQFGGRMPGGALQRQDSGSAMMHHMAVNPIGGMGTEVPKLERFWKIPAPSKLLNPLNIIFYFCDQKNPFYEEVKPVDNELVIMQNPQIMNDPNGSKFMEERLRKMTGEQFILTEVQQPPLFVVCRHRRLNSSQTQPIQFYYILDGTIRQCPDMTSLIQSRLAAAVTPVGDALALAMESLRFNPSRGYWWNIRPRKTSSKRRASDNKDGAAVETMDGDEVAGETDDDDSKNPMNVRTTAYQQERTDWLLHALVQQFPPATTTIVQQANDGLKRVAGALLPAGPQQPQEHTVMVDVDEQDQILRNLPSILHHKQQLFDHHHGSASPGACSTASTLAAAINASPAAGGDDDMGTGGMGLGRMPMDNDNAMDTND